MNKKKHLTGAEHIKIETLVAQGFSIRSIADFLEKSPSTISREIQKHSLVNIPNSCDCNDYNGCNVKHVCGSKDRLFKAEAILEVIAEIAFRI